jgi:hypothetical protein
MINENLAEDFDHEVKVCKVNGGEGANQVGGAVLKGLLGSLP